jgi:hypothetical protein
MHKQPAARRRPAGTQYCTRGELSCRSEAEAAHDRLFCFYACALAGARGALRRPDVQQSSCADLGMHRCYGDI